MRRLVIVGASLAGLRAAQSARAGAFAGEIVVVGEEPCGPYTRPPLSKDLLKGESSVEQCELPHASLNVEWRLGCAATQLDRAAKAVVLSDGTRLDYDRVIIATGSRAREWPGGAADGETVFTLRSLEDSLALRRALERAGHLLIVGAGFIGCEVAASARALGIAVTMVDVAPHPLLALGPELGERCMDLHRSHGVDVRCGVGLRGLERGVATLTDGADVRADVTLFALGAAPNVEWLEGSGLALDPGVACDATLTALDDPDVLAAGDVVSWPHALAGGRRIRIEHWTTAAEHGQLAGRNAVREPSERVPHTAPPYFWSDQYDVKIQAVGVPARAQRLEIVEASRDGQRLVAIGVREGELVAAVALNAAKRLARYRRRLADGPVAEAEIREFIAADEGALGGPVRAAR